MELEYVTTRLDIHAKREGLREILGDLAVGHIIIFGGDGDAFAQFDTSGGTEGKDVVFVGGGGHQVAVYNGGHQLEGQIFVEFTAHEQLMGVIDARTELVVAGIVRKFDGFDLGVGHITKGDGHVSLSGRLAEDFIFGEAVHDFFVAVAAKTHHQAVVDPIVSADADGCAIQPEHIVYALAHGAKAVGNFDIQHTSGGVFNGVAVYDPVGFKGCGGIVGRLCLAEQG